MVKRASTPRLPSIKVPIILMQTDTTVGFLSQDDVKLYDIKSRIQTKPFIQVYSNFATLLACGNRVPHAQKNSIRRSKKTTYIVKKRAFRVAKSSLNSNILRDSTWHFSTSANASGKKFEREFCENKADIIIEDENGLCENSASSLIKINQVKRKRIR